MPRLAAVLAGVVALLVFAGPLLGPLAAPALGAEYRVRLCSTDPAATAGEDMQATFDPRLMSAENRCGFDRQVQLNARARVRWPHGAAGWWELSAPPATRLVKAHVRLEGRSRDGVVGVADVRDGDRSLSPRVLSHSPLDFDWWGEGSALAVGLRCGLFARPRPCRTSAVASYLLARNLDVTLRDDAPPSAPDVSGALVAGAWSRGRVAIPWRAADAGGGVDRVDLLVDGELVRAWSAGCARDGRLYTRTSPCPLAPEGALGLDTRVLSDGQHDVELVASDAAGQSAGRGFGARVDNTPPAAPRGLAVEPVGWTNEDRFAIRWDAPEADAGAPVVAAHVRVDAAPPQRVEGHGLTGVADLAAGADGQTPVSVWLEDEAGNVAEARAARATLRFDGTPPHVAFAERDPAAPALIRARVGDGASGVAGGTLAFRPAGEEPWRTLAGAPRDGELVADLPDHELPPGRYELRATAVDAAGNRSEALAEVQAPLREPVRVVAGLRPVALRARPPAPRVGRPTGARPSAAASPASTPAAPGATALTVPHRARAVLAGRVSRASGAALAGVPVAVEAAPDRPGARWRSVASVRTGSGGRFTLTLRRGASRRVRVTVAATPTLLPASAALRLRARAGVALRARPQRLRNGARVRFSGRVAGVRPRVPGRAKLVVVQFLDRARRRWRPAAVTRTDRRGRFAVRHRFRTVRARTRFAFRALVPAEAGFPYAAGVSGARAVTVVPGR